MANSGALTRSTVDALSCHGMVKAGSQLSRQRTGKRVRTRCLRSPFRMVRASGRPLGIKCFALTVLGVPSPNSSEGPLSTGRRPFRTSPCQLVPQVISIRTEQLQVLRAIVGLFAIQMVHDLAWLKQSTQLLLHHQPVFQDVAAAVNPMLTPSVRMVGSPHKDVAVLRQHPAALPVRVAWTGPRTPALRLNTMLRAQLPDSLCSTVQPFRHLSMCQQVRLNPLANLLHGPFPRHAHLY